jgi:hypothetical protein
MNSETQLRERDVQFRSILVGIAAAGSIIRPRRTMRSYRGSLCDRSHDQRATGKDRESRCAGRTRLGGETGRRTNWQAIRLHNKWHHPDQARYSSCWRNRPR